MQASGYPGEGTCKVCGRFSSQHSGGKNCETPDEFQTRCVAVFDKITKYQNEISNLSVPQDFDGWLAIADKGEESISEVKGHALQSGNIIEWMHTVYQSNEVYMNDAGNWDHHIMMTAGEIHEVAEANIRIEILR